MWNPIAVLAAVKLLSDVSDTKHHQSTILSQQEELRRNQERMNATIEAALSEQLREARKLTEIASLEARKAAIQDLLSFAGRATEMINSSGEGVANLSLLLAKLGNVLRDYPPSVMADLDSIAPEEIEVAYNRLRSSIVPYLVWLWVTRADYPTSIIPLLKVIATALVFNDIEGIRCIRHSVPAAQSQVMSSIYDLEKKIRKLKDRREEVMQHATSMRLGCMVGAVICVCLAAMLISGLRKSPTSNGLLLLICNSGFFGLSIAAATFEKWSFNEELMQIKRTIEFIEEQVCHLQKRHREVATEILTEQMDPQVMPILFST